MIYSRFGYGRSDPVRLPRPLHYMRDEAFVLSELLERSATPDHVLVGHSDGGSIALLYAALAARPRLCGVITEAAHVFCEAKTVAAIERARVHFTRAACAPRWCVITAPTPTSRSSVGATPGSILHFANWDIRAALRSIRVPVLALQGADDEYGTELQLDAIRQQAGAGAVLRVMPQCGHAPHRDQLQPTLDAMAAFVASRLGERRA